MIRKEVIIVLVTFCFTSTLFSIIPVGSQGVREYDPWYDINDDGRIDLKDYFGVGLKYATSGDPAKNVTIAGHANKLAYSVVTFVGGFAGLESPYISVAGYSKISICIYSNAASNYYNLYARHRSGTNFVVDYVENVPANYVETYDVPNEEIRVAFFNADAATRNLNLDVYLIP